MLTGLAYQALVRFHKAHNTWQDEALILFYTSELLRVVSSLHAAGIV
jgi:hypothetical protein